MKSAQVKAAAAPLLLLALLLFVWVDNRLWVKAYHSAPPFTSIQHLENGYRYSHAMEKGLEAAAVRFLGLDYRDNTFFREENPPLSYIAAAALSRLVSDRSERTAILSQVLFMLILALSVYGIGKALDSPAFGVLAAFLSVTSPAIVFYSRTALIDMPLAAMTALSFYCLLRSRAFESRLFSILFGLAWGLAMLTKTNAPAYLAAPLILSAAAIARASMRGGLKLPRLWNLFLSFEAYLLTALPWYLSRIKQTRFFYEDLVSNEPVALGYSRFHIPVMGVADLNFVHYLYGLYGNLLTPLVFLLFAAGLALALIRRDLREKHRLLISALIVSYVIFSLMVKKDPRYLMPVAPFACILAAEAVQALGRLRWALIPLLLVGGVINVAGWHFAGPLQRFPSLVMPVYEEKMRDFRFLSMEPGRSALFPPLQLRIPPPSSQDFEPLGEELAGHVAAGEALCLDFVNPWDLRDLESILYAKRGAGVYYRRNIEFPTGFFGDFHRVDLATAQFSPLKKDELPDIAFWYTDGNRDEPAPPSPSFRFAKRYYIVRGDLTRRLYLFMPKISSK